MDKKCNCYGCRFSRGEITIEERLKEVEKVLVEYEEKLNNIKHGKGETYRNEEGDWCTLDVIKHNIDEIGSLLNDLIYNKCETKEQVITCYELTLTVKDIQEKCEKRLQIAEVDGMLRNIKKIEPTFAKVLDENFEDLWN